MGCAKAPHHLGDVGGNPKQRPLYDYIYVVRYPSIPCPRSHPYTSLALCRQRSMDSKSQALRSESHNDAYIGDRLKATAIAFIILETIFVLLRQWSRHLQKAATGWDDLLIIPSYISCIGLCICAIRRYVFKTHTGLSLMKYPSRGPAWRSWSSHRLCGGNCP